MEELDLSDTESLIKVENFAFSDNEELKAVRLDGCSKIANLEPNSFASGSTSGQELYLSLGRMGWTRVPLFLKKLEFENVGSLDLSDNLLTCDCGLVWLNDLFSEGRLNSNESRVQCTFPGQLEQQEVMPNM